MPLIPFLNLLSGDLLNPREFHFPRFSPMISVDREENSAESWYYPNPSNGTIRLASHVSGPVILFAMNGRMLCELSIDAGKIEIPSRFPDGIYILRREKDANESAALMWLLRENQ